MNILHIDTSPQLAGTSISRQLSSATVERLKAKHADKTLTITYRDLSTDAPSHLSGLELGAFYTAPDSWNDDMKAVMVMNTKILNEFQAADIIVIGVPMYNFGIPSSLKSWIDRLARAGITFRYTEKGPEGLVKNKSVVILSSRGGVYDGTPWGAGLDHQEKYLQDFFGFLGITDCTRIRAEGTSQAELKSDNINKALALINAL